MTKLNDHCWQDSRQVLRVAVIGGGPAGLMAAQTLTQASPTVCVQLYDAMPSVGRKFLLAGKGGLNLTHSETFEPFMARYGERRAALEPLIAAFGPAQLRAWAQALGIETFVGSSGRVFPTDMKAAPLLRAWLHQLRANGVAFFMRHRWLGWSDEGMLKFATPTGQTQVQADAVILALGGGSWARLGSDGAWLPLLTERGVPVAPLVPSNCGFDVGAQKLQVHELHPVRHGLLNESSARHQPSAGWSDYFAGRFAGHPFKSVVLHFTDARGRSFSSKGEFVATHTGVEGSLIYAASSLLRDEIAANGSATFWLDLLPDKTPEQVLKEVYHPRGSRSLSSHLKSRLGLAGMKAAVLYEVLGHEGVHDLRRLCDAIKALPITVVATRALDEAISTAGGVMFTAMDADLRLTALRDAEPPVFCAGEMLDWEAPTGGYLITASMASGCAAGQGVLKYLKLKTTE